MVQQTDTLGLKRAYAVPEREEASRSSSGHIAASLGLGGPPGLGMCDSAFILVKQGFSTKCCPRGHLTVPILFDP